MAQSKTADVRVNAATLARLLSESPTDGGLGLGRKVNDRRVRSVARDVIDRLMAGNRTGYTAHAYTVAESWAIHDAMAAHGRGAPTADVDAARKALARPATARKASKTTKTTKTARKVAPVASDGSES